MERRDTKVAYIIHLRTLWEMEGGRCGYHRRAVAVVEGNGGVVAVWKQWDSGGRSKGRGGGIMASAPPCHQPHPRHIL